MEEKNISNNPQISSNSNNNQEISNLKEEIKKLNQIIDKQKSIIDELQNSIKNYNDTLNNYNNIINKYKSIIIQKDIELNNIKSKLLDKSNMSDKNNINFDEMISVNFISKDKKLYFAIPCVKTTIFAEIEEKLYQQYPELRETNNNFEVNGKKVLRFKTIEENKIGTDLVTLITPL